MGRVDVGPIADELDVLAVKRDRGGPDGRPWAIPDTESRMVKGKTTKISGKSAEKHQIRTTGENNLNLASC